MCGADRTAGERGYCGESDVMRIARAALHHWEEPCLSGERGSGTIFFSGCSLRCVYCQNAALARGEAGVPVSAEKLALIMTGLQDQGAHNINLVTPTHFSPMILEAVRTARGRGLAVPIVYNTGGYENGTAIRRLKDNVDIYLTDLKYIDPTLSARYSDAPDYFSRAAEALEEMVRQQPEAVFDPDGILRKGVIVRHLVLPDCTEDSRRILRYLHETYGDRIHISIMNQYTPMRQAERFPELSRRLTAAEYEDLIDFAIGIGIENGFIQEDGTAEESFIPEFNNEGI